MPRGFDSDDVAHDRQQLVFTETVDCEACGEAFTGLFHDDSDTVDDIVEAPVGEHRCPGCGHRFASALTGWTFFNEAG